MSAASSGSQLQRAIASGRFVITAEITPPVSCNRDDVLAKALPLKGLADAVNVTDGAGARAHLGAQAAATILLNSDIEPVLQLTCRDRNRLALQSDLLGAAALGIRNLLVLRGDDPTAGDQPDAKPVFDLNSGALDPDRGRHPRSRRAALGPQGDRQGRVLHRRCRHADRSAQGLAAEEPQGKDRGRRAIRADPVLHGYRRGAPLRGAACPGRADRPDRAAHRRGAAASSGRSARWIKEHLYGAIIPDDFVERLEYSGDAAAEGKQICIDFIEQLATVPGVAGAHVMAPNHESAIPDVIARARTLVKDRAKAPRTVRRAG